VRTPIVIGECDPEGCAACRTPADAYRNGAMYSSYTAASFARIPEIAAEHGVNIEGALTWAFEFEDQPPFAGFRQLASDGIDLPVLNVFRMFGMMGGNTLPVQSSAGLAADSIRTADVRAQPDVSAIATLDGNRLAILLWHYHDDDVPGPDASIDLTATGAGKSITVTKEYLIDATHSNSYTAWKAMGSPATLTGDQRARLEKAGQLTQADAPPVVFFRGGRLHVHLQLPRQGVALLLGELK
jgi:xylan 1,4-beta-xylosidase